ncbi:ABC-2 transporter permease [Facklamia sp. P12934]|uniref:ABC-2 transporter permease n=1 Tax=unclassified Facklamia TaxID=2622293 RepID=UPI003D180993
MKALIHKEFILNSKKNLLIFMAIFFVGCVLSDSFQIPIICPVVLTVWYPLIMNEKENFKKSGVLLNSLPIEAEKIVLAKYVYTILMGTLFFISFILPNYLLPEFKAYSPNEVLIAFTYSIGSISFSYFAYYVIGKFFYQICSLMSFYFFFFLAKSEGTLNEPLFAPFTNFSNQFSFQELLMPLSVYIILSLSLSYILAARSYSKKDF